MTESEMYEDIRIQMRGTNVTALEALHKTLLKAGSTCLPYFKGEDHLYVQCDNIPWRSIRQIEFLASSNFLRCRIVAINGVEDQSPKAFINVFKEPR